MAPDNSRRRMSSVKISHPPVIRKWLVLEPRQSERAQIWHNPAVLAMIIRATSKQAEERSRACRWVPGSMRDVETPAYVLDERRLLRDLKRRAQVRDRCGFKLLYALKPLSCEFVLELMTGRVDGFAASSLFESRLAREVIGSQGNSALDDSRLASRRAFRARGALRLHHLQFPVAVTPAGAVLDGPTRWGCGSIRDCRWSATSGTTLPARAQSSVFRSSAGRAMEAQTLALRERGGLHIHTNCDSSSFEPLHRTVEHLVSKLGDRLWQPDLDQPGRRISPCWAGAHRPSGAAVERLRSRYGSASISSRGRPWCAVPGTWSPR